MSGGLDGRVAFVTGAGSPTGIGLACARALADAGARIAVTATTTARAKERAREIGGETLGLALDLRDETAVREAIDQTVEAFGRLDILVNNAAAGAAMAGDGSVTALTLDAWDETFAINVRGPMLAARYALPTMLNQGAGAIINISSQAARTGSFHTAYGASKAALDNLTLNIAFAYGKQGVRANAVSPGMVMSRELPEAFVEGWRRQTLTRDVGRPQDIAALVAFLASDEAKYITGQIIAADGGLLSHGTWTGLDQW